MSRRCYWADCETELHSEACEETESKKPRPECGSIERKAHILLSDSVNMQVGLRTKGKSPPGTRRGKSSKRLGYTTVSITLDVYSHARPALSNETPGSGRSAYSQRSLID